MDMDMVRKLSTRSGSVNSVDLNPSKSWVLVGLNSGLVDIWNHESQQLIKAFKVCDVPVRSAKFVVRKNWVITGSDDKQIRVFNYNTLERVHIYEAHSDYIRSIAVHPTQSCLLTSSDDMLIKLWNWEKQWTCQQVFEGHAHFVMQIVINPKDNNTFASASLDRTVKVWQMGSTTPNFTLYGHEKRVHCVDYYHGGDKPYLISGADDGVVKIWDYQNKICVQTLEGDAQNILAIKYHPDLWVIMTGSEDGIVRIWHSDQNKYSLKTKLNYGLKNVRALAAMKGSNNISIGHEEGSLVIKIYRDKPAISMDCNGGLIRAKDSMLQHVNISAVEAIEDYKCLTLKIERQYSILFKPQTITHHYNGRFLAVHGNGDYAVLSLKGNKPANYGHAEEVVWASNSCENTYDHMYAVREKEEINIFKNYKQLSFTLHFSRLERIFGGFLLGVRSESGLAFYEWESIKLVRRIEIVPKHIYWSKNGELVSIITEESYFILKFSQDAVSKARETRTGILEDGVDDAFDVLGEVNETVRTGVWVGDCFIYTNSLNRLNYYVGGEIVTVSHLDRIMYLLGYIPKDNRLYLGDKELNVVSYSLLLSVLEYQTAVMRRDFDTADKVLPTIPREQRTRVAHFLEKQGFKPQALAVSTDPEHRFDLALQLSELKIAYQLAKESQSEQKWKQLADLATAKCQFELAQECLHNAQDFGALLLLATSSGSAGMVKKLGESAQESGKNNVAFLSYFLLGDLEKCLEVLVSTNRLPEAAFFARTYLPSQISRVVGLWKKSIGKINKKAADSLADPTKFENLFSGLNDGFKAEQFLLANCKTLLPASEFPNITPNHERSVMNEMKQAEDNGDFVYKPRDVQDDEDDASHNNFEDTIESDVKPQESAPNSVACTKPKVDQELPVDSIDSAAIEEELELDLENMKLDETIDTSDFNLDDELSDEY